MENQNHQPSPLDSLKSRMMNQKPTGEKTEPTDSGFGFTINGAEEIKNDLPENEPEIEEEKKSLLKKMKRYTVDENGNDVGAVKKPDYRLDSVNEILVKEGVITKEQAEAAALKEAEESFKGEEISSKSEEKNVSSDTTVFISDIDSTPEEIAPDVPISSDTATIRFTPIKGTNKLSVSSMTKPIEITGIGEAALEDETVQKEVLAETEFEKYTPEFEIRDRKDAKEFILSLAKKKRLRFIMLILNIIFAAVLTALSLMGNTNMLIATVLLALSVGANYDAFTGLAKIYKKECSADAIVSIASVFTLALSVFSVLKHENAYFTVALCSCVLAVRLLLNFFGVSTLHSNLHNVMSQKPKKSVCLIGDNSTALAMAKNSIEGDVLIAASRDTENVTDFMKYSTYGNLFFGKMRIITLVAVGLSAVFGLAAGIMQHSVVYALFISSAILLIASMPILFFIDTLPLKSACSRFKSSGSVLTGFAAADKLEQANATVISTADIFPEGTVTMQSMKVLSDSNVDEIILRAASLTEAMDSPLAPIFKNIAGTCTEYKLPDSDTCKYEEKMGISGWVDDKLLFIGNRTLLEAHGIAAPSLDIDHKILTRGYFPVYVATETKACVLLIVKYSVIPEVSKKLHKITNLGVTLLIDSSDPNLTHDMICDYFDLYEDTIQVMTGAGSKMYKNVTKPIYEASAPAIYRGGSLTLTELMTCASRMKRSNLLLTVLYAFAVTVGTVYFIYSAFTGSGMLSPRSSTVFIFETIVTLFTSLVYLIKKP